VKVLGVILDKRLTMHQHVTKVANEATYACIALRSIKGVRPAQARQLYRSCVLPIVDYAAFTWYGPGKPGTTKLIKTLEKTQRLGARGILRAWKAVSLPALKAEAHLEDTRTRLDKKVAKHAAKIYTLESTHPMRKAISHRKGRRRLCSPLHATVREHVDRIKPCRGTTLQPSPAWAKPPWTSYSNRVEIQERSEALETSRLLRLAGFPTLYTDAASGKRLTGYATVLVRGQELEVVQKASIGWSFTASVLGAELMAMAEALEYAWRHITDTRLVIMSDSQQALKAIAQGYSHGLKQAQVARITRWIQKLDGKGVHTNFRWTPAHAGVEGNERADQAAKEVTHQPGAPTRTKAERDREVEGVITLIHRDIDNKRPKQPHRRMPGQHTWKLDQALPGKHTLKLYGAMSLDQIAILIQALTGHCRLNKSLFTKGLRESAQCGCGRGDETIEHVLLAYPRWTDERKTLRDSVGDRCNDVPFLLGGYGTRKVGQSVDGKRENWTPDIKVAKATVEFLQSTGRLEYNSTRDD
jgi:ribonuclease HI